MIPERNLFTSQTTIVYVEDSFNESFNKYIVDNYNSICRQLNDSDIQFMYLPKLINETEYREILGYNRPHLENLINSSQISSIYTGFKNRIPVEIPHEGLLWFTSIRNNVDISSGMALNKSKPFDEQFETCLVLVKKLAKDNQGPLFRISIDDDYFVQSKKGSFNKNNSNILDKDDFTPDDTFEIDAYRLAEEIKIKMLQLRETGSFHLLDEIIEEVINVKKKLSSLFITNDYRIFLKEYNMKEVVMSPLPKAIYLLFMRHPKGIMFKQLHNHRDELMSIYKNMTTFVDIDRAMESINAMTHPLSNSINENCSRIRSAFLQVINDDLASNYYITGKKGEPKKIILDRSLVNYQ